MPVPQLAPPGHLELHGVLVALTPVAICLVTALAAWLAGGGADARRPGAVRLLAAASLLGALTVQGLFLLPWGAVAAYPDGIAGGLLRIGWLVSGTAFALGLWSLWYWSPWCSGSGSVARWCLRVALALALPVVMVPALVIAVLADDARAVGRRCFLAGAVAVLATAVLLVPGLTPWQVSWPTIATLAFAQGTVTGPWRLPLLAALLAGILAW